jgi:hypothetical protein
MIMMMLVIVVAVVAATSLPTPPEIFVFNTHTKSYLSDFLLAS